MDDELRTSLGQRALDSFPGPEVVVRAARDEDVRRAGGLQAADDGPAEEPAPPGHHHPAAGPERGHPAAAVSTRSGSIPASRRSASSIARYEPSCPVMRVTRAFLTVIVPPRPPGSSGQGS